MDKLMLMLIKIGFVFVIPAILVSVLLINRFSSSAPDPYITNDYSSPQLKKEDAPLPVEVSFDNKALDESINGIISQNSNLDISVSVQNLNNGASYSYGDGDSFYAASITKLVTIASFLNKVDQGQSSLNQVIAGDTADNQIKKMVYYSDNGAWNALRTTLGHQNINAYTNSIGLTSFNSSENLITANDMTQFLAKLYKNELFSEQYTQYLIGLMAEGDQNYPINLGLPAGMETYHKNGWLPDRLNLALVAKNQDQAFAVTVFSKSSGAYDFVTGKKLMAKIAQTIHNNISLSN